MSNPIEELRNQVPTNNSMNSLDDEILINNKARESKDAFVHNLRKNDVLNWTSRLGDILEYKNILEECDPLSTLELQNGIVKVMPSGKYIGHKYTPHVKAGFTFSDMSILMRSEILLFEEEYGEVLLTPNDISRLNEIVYRYNRTAFDRLDMSDAKKLIHLKQSAMCLHFLLATTIRVKNQGNGWCTLTFKNSNYSTKDLCTIFTDEEMELLEKVNKSLQGV